MANKKTLLGGVTLKVESQSGFDKSFYHAFTAPLGSIVPMAKQLLLPGSAECKIKISAQLPPLASDAFLRTHLKVEAFFVPLRLCYGGWQSFFAGEKVSVLNTQAPVSTLSTAKLPRLKIVGAYDDSNQQHHIGSQTIMNEVFGPHTLMDYFGVKMPLSGSNALVPWSDPVISGYSAESYYNIFPFLCYQLVVDHWYRHKSVERPFFAPSAYDQTYNAGQGTLSNLPFSSYTHVKDFVVRGSVDFDNTGVLGLRAAYDDVRLLNGHLLELRQRNYGYDYFTTALPSAQDGSPMSVDTSAGSFTISSLRYANAMQIFAERNQVAGPDYLQVCEARYGKRPSSQIAQRPVLLGSADFPMFTSGVEQAAPFDVNAAQTSNPFEGIGARYGRAHAEGSDFVCRVDVDEPGYLMVMCSLVPEATYALGTPHDMRLFTGAGAITDLPCHELEMYGMEPVYKEELAYDDSNGPSGFDGRAVFGYQPRYMWHKAGNRNMVSGHFRAGSSLESFIPQRLGVGGLSFTQINSAFLKVAPTDLDNVTAVSGNISQYGVMVDSAIQLYVSEPLGESVMPSLSDPAYEHGRSVYVERGGKHV